MKPFTRLKKLLSSSDGRPVQIRMVRAEVDGKEARSVGLGELDTVAEVSETQINLASLRRLKAPETEEDLVVNEEGTRFQVKRSSDGHTETLEYEILPSQEDRGKVLKGSTPGIPAAEDKAYQPLTDPASELVTGEDADRSPGTEPHAQDTDSNEGNKGPMRWGKKNK